MLTTNKLRYIAHWSRTVKGIHGYKVLKDGRLQFSQVFLHTSRLKLESTDGASLLIELIGLGVINRYRVKVYVNTQRLLDIGTSLLQLRESLQSQEVHLNQSCRLDNVSIILRTIGLRIFKVGIVGSRHRHPVADRVAADDKATSMDASTTHRTLEHLGIFDGISQGRIRRSLSLTQFRHCLDSISQIHLRRLAVNIWQTVWDGFT